jgi:outer membrane protein
VTEITLNLDGANWLEPENISEPNVEKSLASVLDRPDLLAQQFRLDAAKQGIRVAQSGRKISVNASANLRTSHSSNNQLGNFGAQFFENQPDVSGGLSVSLPVFDRRRTETNIVRAKLQRDQEELDMADLMQAAETDFRLALLNFNSTKLQLKASKELLSSAEVALEAEQARYNAGAATLLDVTTLQSTRLDAAVSVEESRFDLFVNRLDIALQDGTIEAFLLNQLNTKILELE